MTDHQKKDPKFAEFHGIDRNRINWNPFVDESNCIGCGMCATTCGRGVYKFDYKKRKTVVAQPTNCLVACQTCFNLCPAKAISFAEDDKTREKAQKIVKDFHLIQTVKQELENKKQDLEI